MSDPIGTYEPTPSRSLHSSCLSIKFLNEFVQRSKFFVQSIQQGAYVHTVFISFLEMNIKQHDSVWFTFRRFAAAIFRWRQIGPENGMIDVACEK
jgi:hypothetical protein